MGYYGMDGLGWYDFARLRGFTGTPEELMDIITGNAERYADHALLLNRDNAGQHPISAIEGLERALAELRDAAKAAAPESAWKTVVLAPMLLDHNTEHTITADATKDLVKYYPITDEVDLLDGVWELELEVIGMRLPGVDAGTGAQECIRVGLADREAGYETRYDVFSVGTTQVQAVDQMLRMRAHAFVTGGHKSVLVTGFRDGAAVTESTGDGGQTASKISFVNAVTLTALKNTVNYATHGIVLRYRRVKEG
ncbi:MAG: hypothetical protein IJ302_03580 [Clostridia bacterium]|nr:hypothetical protein [Clostridia bacterium]